MQKTRIAKTMSANPRRIGKVEVVFDMLDKNYSDKEKAMMERCARICPVHHGLHPDVVQVFIFDREK